MSGLRRWWPRRYVDAPFVVTAVVCGAMVLYLGRGLTFWHDEWRSITFDGGPVDYLRPVNQHWSTFPLLLYRGTFGIVGLRSYVPYLAEVVALHILAVCAAYALMRRRIGPPAATIFALPLLLLGSGAENLFWGFQTGFVGSVMFGLWAVFFLERAGRRSAAIASVLLLGALMASGIGLFFLVVAAVRAMQDPALVRRALVVVPPLAAYVVWFLAVGRSDVGEGRLFVELGVVRFVVRGLLYATERVSGLGHLPEGHALGLVAFVTLAVIVVVRAVRGRRSPLAAGCLAAAVAMYVGIAFVRVEADPGYDHALSSRFVYVAAFFFVLAVVDLLPPVEAWSARPLVAVAASAALAGVVLANAYDLREKRAEFQETANRTRAFVALALERGREPWVDRHAQRGWMPTIAELERVVARHGTPTEDSWFRSVVPTPTADDEAAALLGLIGDGYRIEPAARDDALTLVGVTTGPDVSNAGRCALARLDPGTAAWIDGLPPGTRVRVSATRPFAGRLFLSRGGPATPLFVDFDRGRAQDVVIPDIGDGRSWSLVVDSPRVPARVTFCVRAAPSTATRPPHVDVGPW